MNGEELREPFRPRPQPRGQQADAGTALRRMGVSRSFARGGHRGGRYGSRRPRPQPRPVRMSRAARPGPAGPGARVGSGQPAQPCLLRRSMDRVVAVRGPNAILDTAFTVMIEACVGGSVDVLQQRLRKMLLEERYHFLHGRSWLRSGIDSEPLQRAWREAIEWFGPPDGESARLH